MGRTITAGASDGGPIRLDNGRRVFDPAVIAARLVDVTLHDLRHVAASLGISSGASTKAVQRMLGHRYGDDLADRLDGPGVDGAADQVRTVAPVASIRLPAPGTGSAPLLA